MNRALSTALMPNDLADELADWVDLNDWDDAPATRFDVTPFALQDASTDDPEGVPTPRVPMPSSFVRVRRSPDAAADTCARDREAVAFLDVMGEQQLNLTVNLFCLESSATGVAYDPSARAAADTLRTRIAELCDLRDALNEVYLEGSTAAASRLFAADAPLIEYVKGLYLWCAEVTAALTVLAAELRTLTPDWLELRRSLDRASHWYFDGLVPDVRHEVASLEAPALLDLAGKVDELLWAASYAHAGLDKKFG